MATIQIAIDTTDETAREILIAQLSQMNYEGFEETGKLLLAYVNEEFYDEEMLREVVSDKYTFQAQIIPNQNWNALWESNFQPVVVDDFCAVRAKFHEPIDGVQHDILITPKMSFGTGHHATTYMMMNAMRNIDFAGKRTADFGTGTGVLAILAEKLGSATVLATDHDDWSIENATENIEKNNCTTIEVLKADGFTTNNQFDIILANINRNVILDNVTQILGATSKNGQILLSGLLVSDVEDIVAAFNQKAELITQYERSNWACLLFNFNG